MWYDARMTANEKEPDAFQNQGELGGDAKPAGGGTMPAAVIWYVRGVDWCGRRVGRAAMYLIFAMAGVLLYSVAARVLFSRPPLWTVETAQFMLAAYYLLGGAYSMQLDSHVRMDLFYGRWSPRARAATDAVTALCLLFYLCVLLVGGADSARYALEYGQKNYSAWAPPLAPVKIMMCAGIFLMLLQAVAFFFRDVAKAAGREL